LAETSTATSAGEPSRSVELLSLPWPLLADLQDELAVHCELEELAVDLVVACEPDEVVVVDEDAMLAFGPLIALAGAAPMANQVAGLVKDEDRRRSDAAFAGRWVLLGGALARGQRVRPMHQPDAIVGVGRKAGDLAENPVVGKRLRPERIDLELRRSSLFFQLGLGGR
jgi:hypothetical protein